MNPLTTRSAAQLAVLVFVAVTTISCSGDDDAPRADSPTSVTRAAAPTTTPTTRSPPSSPAPPGPQTSTAITFAIAPTVSPTLSPTIPATVAAQGTSGSVEFPGAFSSFVGGGDTVPDCDGIWEAVPTNPYIGLGHDELSELWLGQELQLCFAGFDLDASLTVTVTRPDGTTQRSEATGAQGTEIGPTDLLAGELPDTMTLDSSFGYLGTTVDQIEPTMPLGRYALSAEQAGHRADASVDVAVGEVGEPEGGYLKPQNDPASVYTLRSGDEVRLLMLYFEPDATVPLALYRNTGDLMNVDGDDQFEFEFVQQLDPAQVGDQGWGFHSFIVPGGLPPAGYDTPEYCVATIPELAPQNCEPDLDVVFSTAE